MFGWQQFNGLKGGGEIEPPQSKTSVLASVLFHLQCINAVDDVDPVRIELSYGVDNNCGCVHCIHFSLRGHWNQGWVVVGSLDSSAEKRPPVSHPTLFAIEIKFNLLFSSVAKPKCLTQPSW